MELHFFAGSAQAQAATGDVTAFQDIASVDGVASVETLDDGRVELTLQDGSVLMVPAGEVQILNGTVFVSESFLIAQGLTAASNNTVLLLTLGAVGVAVAVNALESTSDSDDDVVPPVATPPPMPPVFTSNATASVAENQTDAYRAVATDADGDTLNYSLSGTDAARLMIDAATGEVRFREAPDFEAPGDADGDNVYDIIVTASDGTNSAERAVAIMVTNENDNDPIFTSDSVVSVAENQTDAYTALATDADGDTLSYSLSGTDATLFTIDAATGEVCFIEAPDFENPGDADGDNVYDIIVTASDGTNSTDQAVAITVTNENDNTPSFTSNAAVSVAEKQTEAYTAVATDADGDDLSYNLSGTDAALFMINAMTGEVRFRESPDFENPGDADGDNVYDIVVTASDGTNSAERAVAITVTNENDNDPIFTSDAAVSVAENQTEAYTALATDADGDTLSYSLSGTDATLFTIDAATGEVRFREAPDFENPGDAGGDNVYDIIVMASDGTNSAERAVAIMVTNENDNDPIFTSDSVVSVAENQTDAYTALATDADGDTLSYSLSGTDATLFTIDAATGEVCFIEAPDFENPGDADGDNVYDIIVTASDGTNSTDQAVAITVTNENDNTPSFTSNAAVSVAEKQTEAYTAVATDADGDDLSYNLSGTDAALFMINAMTGEVRFRESPDFENPGDADGDNVYDIVVTASDGTNSAERAVAITVTNENDNDPIFTSDAAVSVAENQTEAYTALATDADGDTLSYSLSGTDATLFTIDAATGEVRFREAPDFENPGDAGGDNVYDIIVTVSDGTNSTDQAVAITVTDENDPPSVIDLSLLDGSNGFTLNGIDENGLSGFSVSFAGDVNSDGYDDLIVGARGADPNGNSGAGETYVVYGGARAPGTDGVLDLSALDGTNGFTLTGIDMFDYSGFSVSSAGDVNGDGYHDLIIGAYRADPGGESVAGETYVVYGGARGPGTDGVLDLRALNGINGFTLAGIDANDLSGFSVSSAGDVNGDGYDDLIIGARGADPGGNSEAGETYVVYGGAHAPGTGGVLALWALDGTNGFTLTGIDTDDLSGFSASSAGDVNGDGYDDLIIGANRADPDGNSGAGETYLVYGGVRAPGISGVLDLSALDGTNGFTLTGIDANDLSGFSVSSAGDVNGDGYDDLIIGAFRADPGGNSNAGETYLVYGGARAPGAAGVLDLSALDGANGFTLTGLDVFDYSGFSVSSAGDVNGDGYDDLIIGAYRADPDGDSSAGETYLVFGGTRAPGTGGVLDLSALDGTNGFTLIGIDANDLSGFSVSSARDVNGDGYDDLIIGANRADPNGERDAGETYVVYGGATGTESTVPITAQGTASADNFTGNAGGDSFTGIATDDVVRGGAGDDSISITSLDFADIDGGTGKDSLVLDGSNRLLDLRGAGNGGVDSVEVFDLSATGANTLVLDALAVFDLTEERAGGIATLDVLGDGNDTADLRDSNFAYNRRETEDGTTYIVYRAGNADVRVEAGVQILIPGTTDDNAPSFTSGAAVSVPENRIVAYTAVATDPDGDPLSYSLSGTDGALFTIDPNTGVVSFIAPPDFENPDDSDDNNVYDIIVTASDGPNRTNQAVAITVTNTNDNDPIFISGSSAGVAENQRVDSVVYTAIATDADEDPLSYSLSGTDAALFTINPNTGAVRFIAPPDVENPGDNDRDNVYDIVVTASDGTNHTDQAVAITVTGENEVGNPPIFTSADSVSVAENQSADSVVYTAQATDEDGDPLTYSLSGTDAALFMIDPARGEVRFIEAPDFEAPGNVDGDNVYDIVVRASDGTNHADQTVAITVTNENDNIPSFTSDATASVTENQTAAYTAQAGDGDGDTLTYGLSGTDAALFTINPATGVVSFMEAPDFENPGDAGGNNVYDITVTASDDTNESDHDVTITVTNENDNDPIFTSDAFASVAENLRTDSVVYTAQATDADGDDLSYSLSGTDASRFTINPATGVVSFMEAPDFENPGDAGGNNVYDITVTASDDTNESDHDVTITVTNENDNDPIFTSDAFASVAENLRTDSVVYTAQATDADGDDLSYSLSGTDAALFTINPATGVVSFMEAPDFENPGDAGGNNVYDITVTASDDTNESDHDVTITVTNENDNDPIFTSDAFASVAENLRTDSVVYTAQATDADGDDLSYSLSGTDASRFTINPATGVVSFMEAPDFENPGDAGGNNVYDITVTASDDTNESDHDVTITVTNENDNDPIFTSDAFASVAENLRTDSVVYTAQATDADGDDLSYSLSGTDASRFMIDPATGVVSFIASPDFENPDDAGGDNVYDITVTASDGDNSTNHDVAITVTNVNEDAPSFTSPDSVSVAENQTAAYTAVATDADGDTLTYGLSGTDAALFTIDPNTGVVRFIAPPDFENPGDDGDNNVYDITVTASEGDNSTNHDVAIRVTNTNDNDPIFISGNSIGVPENQRVDSVVYTAMATDADDDPLTYSLSGTDASLFMIDPATGAVRFVAPPDFENPGDDGDNNVYDITVTASDGDNSTNHDVAITVTNVNEDAPSFTSPDSVSVAENQTAAYTAVATDADGDTLTYGLSGTDAALFTIDPNTGVVRFIAPPDFENPGDDGDNNVYDITVTASDGDNSTDHDVAITVTNINDNTPSFTSPDSANVAENETLAYTAVATDADGDDLTYSLSGTDAARFTINPVTGAVSFMEAPDFENPDDAGGDNVYNITVTASDDTNESNHDVTITVTNENDNAPIFNSGNSASVAENHRVDTLVYMAMAMDADGDDLTYSLSGADAARFTIDPATGAVRFIASPDFENPGDDGDNNVYDITVTASDGDNSTNHDVAITVTNVNEDAPSFTSPDSVSVAENQTAAYTAVATDADGDTLTYGLSGTDAALFTIDPNTGVVRFIAPPDFENPGDDGDNNVYDITVTASDGDNSTDHDVAITVTNINDNTPSFTSPDSANVAENETLAYTAVATDADGDDLTYSLSGTDAARFTINPVTGAVSFMEAPDFENPDDAGGDNVYNITVTASDDTNESNHDVTITVTNENDNAPIFNSGNSASVAENHRVDTLVYMAMATDADGDDLTYSLSGADAARFTIDPATGAVRFIASPDFENPGDIGGDNVYDITVTASDDDNSTDHDVAITVTNENDSTPSFTSPDSADVAENETLAYTAVAMDADGDDLSYSLSGTDATRFTIDPATGAVRFIASPDFENPNDAGGDNVYNITVTASDDTNESNHDVAITVTNENDNDPIFISGNSVDVVENQPVDSVVYTAIAADADGDTLTYSLSGTDASLFTIDPATGDIRFITVPDVEAPGDANRDNVYEITVTASDDTNDIAQAVAITVTNVNEDAPLFTSPDSASVAENQTVAYTAAATDADGDPLMYSLSGTDATLFTIDPATGVVSFITPPDFEDPGDAGGNNIYNITVTASDDTNESNHDVAITVTNENDNDPLFTSDAIADVAENQTAAYTAIATDADGDDLIYSLSGTDAALFMIDPATGVVSFIEAPDFENPGDIGGDNVYGITVTASDDDNSTNHDVTITVTNENDNAPIFNSGNSAGVAENHRVDTLVYMAMATDADGDDLTYSLSGADAARFTIDPATGAVRFIASPDFENPGDDGDNNVYDITVTASDGDNSTNHDVAITVTNVNEDAPSFTSPDSVSVAENQTAAYTAVATDADGDTLTYGLSGTDAALFTIDPNTGVVRFIAPPDFENPGDDGDNNVYDITVTASDGDNSTDHDVAITVTNINDNTPSFTSPDSANVAENETLAYTAVATDADGDDLTYSLSGTDAARFTINPVTGAVSFMEAPDFENPDDAGGDNVYNITVTASDDTNESNHDVTITVTNENDNAPIFNSGNSASVAENHRVDTLVYMAMATDADGDDLTYSLSGADAARFTIDPATGAVRFIASPDFENPGDIGGDNVYDITVTASDDDNSTDHDVAITVTNENDSTPSFTSPDSADVAENETLAYTAVAMDADGDDLSYSLSGTDATRFTIDPATGAVRFIASPDFENPNDAGGDNVYNITVTASDDTNESNHDVAITVTNENDNDPIFISGNSVDVVENQPVDSVVYTAIAADADGDTLSYSLSGTDASLFTIDPATGDIRFITVPDVEAPGDANRDNVYEITVTASDDTNDIAQAVAITVTNVNEDAPLFTSPDSASVAENQTVAYTAAATDADGDPLMYSLSGTDATLFTIDPATGVVSFITPPDFEDPGDAGGNNIYNITVTASDDTNESNHDVAITVTNENDNDPLFTSDAIADVAENQTAAYTAIATDADGDDLIYSLSGTDAALFMIDPATGVVSFIEAPDFENPGDIGGDNVYGITVTASDDDNSTNHDVTITVTNENDNAPIFNSGNSAGVAENHRVNTLVYMAMATDADGDDLTYSLSGADAARFTIDPATGAVRFIASPDFENPGDIGGDNVYNITVTASDDTNESNHDVTITVTNENDNAPIFNSGNSASVAENHRVDTLVYMAMATDADGDDLTYSLSGADAARFTIDPATGAVRFIASPDFENPGDIGGDNVYDITVTASDDDNSTDHDVAITVTNENDSTPSFTSPDSADVAENETLAYTAVAMDADGDDLSYSLSGTDATRFTIDPATGAVRFIASPDFENPNDAGGDNVYNITVTASDDTNESNHDVAITVTNENDNDPIFISGNSVDVVENQPVDSVVYTAIAADADGDTLTYSLSGTDASLFTIDPATGDIRFITVPDVEAPGDANRDNVYEITVTASDDTNDIAQAVAITVTNVNEDAPLFTSPDSASVAENQTVAYTAAATDADGDPLMYSLSGTDATLFTIDPATGVVSFITPPDFEDPGDAGGNNIYNITVTASDDTNESNHDVAITVTNENDNDPLFTSDAIADVAENQTAAYTAIATDADGDDLIYSLSGTDAALFMIDPATGVVSFIEAPDFENPGDIGGDNVYGITVTASDDDNSTNHDVTITVTNENDNAPIFNSGNSAGVAENHRVDTLVYMAMATDADGDDLTYSLSGADAARFTIDPATGAVRFIASPDFENPDDAGGDNVYNITVTASDDDSSTNHDVAITVTNENDNDPLFTSPDSASVAEDQTLAYTAVATDADGDDLIYSLSGTDAARFTINPTTGAVSFIEAPDFENPGDIGGDNVYDITVTASDDDSSTNHDVAITVTNENDNDPLFTSPDSASVAEDQTLAYTAVATDADGDDLIYSLSGTDAARFMIDPATGVVSFITPPDFENPDDAGRDNIYDITVTASDDDNSTNHDVTITVTNGNDNDPIFNSGNSVGVAENHRVDSVVYTAAATDADEDPLTYSLSGADAARFTIDPATGAVRFIAPPDFENPNDAGGDNVYNITVTASDDDNSTDHDVAITVTNINDNTPSFTSPDSANVAENETLAYTAVATDADGDDLSYSLSGTDAARFTIDPVTGAVSFMEAPDFENPDDAGGDNVYNITVTASDDTNESNHDVAITVTNENDNDPIFISGNSVGVLENQPVDSVVYTAIASDADGDTLTYSLSGTDAARFTIDPATGAVRFIASPDFENPGDDDGDNIYDIVVTASDGMRSTDQPVTITVTDEDDTSAAIDLSMLDGSNGFILNGVDAYDFSGFSVSSAGDVNGDGYDDLIIGAYRADSFAGETYVVYGGATGAEDVLNLSPPTLDGTNGFTLTGTGANDYSGISVSSAGDVNGDGYGDLIIGASGADSGGDRSGETYLVYGGATGTDLVLDRSTLDGTNGFTLTGTGANDYSGISVSSAGDVNGDGYDDLIIGAWGADSGGDRAGETYVVYGGATGIDLVLDRSTLDGTNGFILTGIDAGDRSGISVSSAGDVNGDGYEDLIIGAYVATPNGDRYAGETYVVYGGARSPGTEGVLALSVLDGANGFTLTGSDADDRSGFSVSSAGDVNGDGYDDLIIGAYRADPGGKSNAGETYVVYGGATGTDLVLDRSTLDGTNGFTLTGSAAGDRSGTSVSSAGDLNGDGYDDLIIGADRADPNGEASGETYVVYGGARAPGTGGVLDLSPLTLNGTNGFTLTGIDPSDNSGRSVSSAGDVNGDGYDDLIIGANQADPNGNRDAGETYLVYGGATGTESTAPITAQGTAAADNFTGKAGEDRFTDIAADDVVRGGAGDDSISVTSLDFANIDGGTGRDTLVLNGSNLSLDLTSPGNAGVDSVEVIDLSGTGAGTLVLDALAVFDLTEERAGGMATLDVLGDADDKVRLTQPQDQSFVFVSQVTEGGTTYDVYRAGNAEVRVETGVQVQTLVTAIDLSMLDGSNGFILNGVDANDSSGFSVSSAGDVNGDGYDDLIIGANRADITAGETYVVYGAGSAAGTEGVLDLSALDGTNGFTLAGIELVDFSGISVSSAGDVNGDGYDDLIIGASGGDPGGYSRAGETYVVYGGAHAPGADGVLALSALDGTNGFTLNGIDVNDRSGYSVSSAGDVNGDGYDDLIIGARGADPGGDLGSGETYVVYGGAPGTDGVLDLSMLDGSNGFILNGIDADDSSGISVSSAGDVNGDGYDDLIIGARGADSRTGETYVVYGGARMPGTDGVLDLSMLDGTNGFILNGIDEEDYSGRAVSSAGDVNGDGYDDLIIGANRVDRTDPDGTLLNNVGEIYVVYGGATGTDLRLNRSTLDGTNGFTLTGIDAGDYSGYSVSSAGDVNGDGYDDLIIGANRADPGRDSNAGETYVVYGGAPGAGGVLHLSMLDGTNGFILTGVDANDESGSSVSSAGDVNGDGFDDLIIGAIRADPGETYLVYGGETGTESTAPITALGTAAADNFTGNVGADSFTGIAAGDVVRGGAGDDSISVTSLDFADIDGGTGRDALVLDGSNLSLDLTDPGNGGVDSVEVFDLSGTGGNTLVLDALAVFDLTEERAGGMATLDVLGDADDRVELRDSNFTLNRTVTEDDTIYNVYRDGNGEVRVQNGVAVTLGTRSSSLLSEDPDPVAMPASPAPDLSRPDALLVPGGTGLYQLSRDVDHRDSLTEWMDNGLRNDQWHDRWHEQRGGLWHGSFRADGLNSLDKPDRHRLNQEPVFEDLSVRDSIPDMQDTGEDAVLIPLPVPAVAPMAQPVLESDTPLHNDLAMILQDMEIFADPVKHGDTDMDGF